MPSHPLFPVAPARGNARAGCRFTTSADPQRRRALVACTSLAMWAAASCVGGCPRDRAGADAGEASASLSAAAYSASIGPGRSQAGVSVDGDRREATSAWPKVVIVPDPVNASRPVGDDPDGAAAAGDALVDADPDASDADAREARPDVVDDAPLLGARTFAEEVPARGIRKITSNAAKVHKAPKDGAGIVSLPKGTEVSLVAEYLDWYRVRYTDPNTQQRRQGWIYLANFVGPRVKSCPPEWTHHEQDGGWCDKECTRNTDCKGMKGYKCSGTRCFYAGD